MYTYTRDYRVPLSRTTRDLPFKAMISNLNCPITRFDFSVSLSLSLVFASFVSPSPYAFYPIFSRLSCLHLLVFFSSD